MPRSFSCARDPMSCYTHFLGACLSVAATLLLFLRCAATHAPVSMIVSVGVFGLSLLALYSASALYHYYPGGKTDVLRRLRKLDHSIIYVLIAGTYTPIAVRYLTSQRAIVFLAVIWGVALVGIIVKLFWLTAPRALYTALYLLMGWALIFDWRSLVSIDLPCLLLIGAGGLCYSVGAAFYIAKRPNPTPDFGFHELFHVMILAGSLCHFLAIFIFVLA